MKWFALLLPCIIFLTLITNFAQSTAVDDSGGNEMVSEEWINSMLFQLKIQNIKYT